MENLELETNWWDLVKRCCCCCGFRPCQPRPASSSLHPDDDNEMEEEVSSSDGNYPAPHVIVARHYPDRRYSDVDLYDEEYTPGIIPILPRKYRARPRSPYWGRRPEVRSSFAPPREELVDSLEGSAEECRSTVLPIQVQVEHPPSSSNIAPTQLQNMDVFQEIYEKFIF